jgi:hypothetical protein
MEKGKASILLDSLGMSDIRLSGECSETCRLTISDLKTERDVRLMVKAIIELGCCQIDKIAPIFRSESTSILRLAETAFLKVILPAVKGRRVVTDESATNRI